MQEYEQIGKEALLAQFGNEQVLLQHIYQRVGNYLRERTEPDALNAFQRVVGDLRRQSKEAVLTVADAIENMPSFSPQHTGQYAPVEDENIRARELLITELLTTVGTLVCEKLPLVQWFRENLKPACEHEPELVVAVMGGASKLNAPVLHRVVEQHWTLHDILSSPDLQPASFAHKDSITALLRLIIWHVSQRISFDTVETANELAIVHWVVTGEWYRALEWGRVALPQNSAVVLTLPVGLHPGAAASIYRRRAIAQVRTAKILAQIRTRKDAQMVIASLNGAEPEVERAKPSSDRVLQDVLAFLQARRRGLTWETIAKSVHKAPADVKRKVERCLRSLGCSYTADEL
ncbi:MAG: hypothetical protein WHX60_05875 [Armatimonadota bacterium]